MEDIALARLSNEMFGYFRFFVQRDSNQRENNIWSLTISNHPNKTVPFTQSFHSPRLGDLKPSNVV